MNPPVNNIVAMEILYAFEYLFGVAAEHGFLEFTEPGQQLSYGTPGHKLHKDVHYVVLQARPKEPTGKHHLS